MMPQAMGGAQACPADNGYRGHMEDGCADPATVRPEKGQEFPQARPGERGRLPVAGPLRHGPAGKKAAAEARGDQVAGREAAFLGPVGKVGKELSRIDHQRSLHSERV